MVDGKRSALLGSKLSVAIGSDNRSSRIQRVGLALAVSGVDSAANLSAGASGGALGSASRNSSLFSAVAAGWPLATAWTCDAVGCVRGPTDAHRLLLHCHTGKLAPERCEGCTWV